MSQEKQSESEILDKIIKITSIEIHYKLCMTILNVLCEQ